MTGFGSDKLPRRVICNQWIRDGFEKSLENFQKEMAIQGLVASEDAVVWWVGVGYFTR